MDAQYAGFWRRFAAVFIDGLVVMVLGFISGLVLGVLGLAPTSSSVSYSVGPSFSTVGGALPTLVGWVIAIGYVVVYQAKMGQTLGKKALGVKIVDSQGKTPSMITFFLREVIGKIVSAITLGIGYLWMLWDGKKQTLHDKIASTFVIKV